MERFVKGDIVVIPFPFSDLSSSKNRPSLVAATLKGNDLILCQITSQQRDDQDAILLSENDFRQGKLKMDSFIRPSRLFTADISIVNYRAGKLKETKIKQVQEKLCEIFTR
ncbi:MAG: type II toxin-antitoxin system PemK/MazF family toxin [Candidatus Woesearchaeota archaeon]